MRKRTPTKRPGVDLKANSTSIFRRANASLRSEVFGLSGIGVRLAWNAHSAVCA